MSNPKPTPVAVPDSTGKKGGEQPVVPGGARKGSAAGQRVDPEALLADIARSHLVRMILWSSLIHFVLIGGTSVHFIKLCFDYQTLHPKQVVKQKAREAAEKKVKDDEDARVKAAIQQQEDAKKKTAADKGAPGAAKETPAVAPATGAAPDGKEPEKKKSKIEQELEKTSSERPKKTSISLDNASDLE